MVWDDETIRSLRDLWAQGLSTAEIGRRLGVSKNAIVGKAHRLDLDARPSPIRRESSKPQSDRLALQRAAGPTLPPLASTAMPPVEIPAQTPERVVLADAVVVAPVVVQPVVAAPVIPVAASAPPIDATPVDVTPVAPPEIAASVEALKVAAIAAETVVPLRPQPVAAEPRPALSVVRAPAPAPVSLAPPRSSPLPAMVRRSAPSCCWPIGEPGTKTFRFCDDNSLPGKPYCDEHARLAYVKIKDRKEDAA